ncbi:MAG: proteinase inhibitor [Sandaracinaceae bacterium]
MRVVFSSLLLLLCVPFSVGCDGDSPDPVDAGSMTDAGSGGGDPDFVASCVYVNTFADAEECLEYRGAGWDEASATRGCRRAFLNTAGTLTLGSACTFASEVGRCVVGDLASDGYTIVSSGDASACGAAQSGCETFAGGTFTAAALCDACTASGTEGPGAIVPTEPDCRDALPGEPAGLTGGQVCTPTLISGSTEPGRRFADYADCDVVRSQRPYYAMAAEVEFDEDDARLSDSEYMAELAWVTEQAEASACACCHTDSDTPSGAALWNTEGGPLWIDTVSDEALAMFGGFTDSAAFGFMPSEENNGFDRSTTGLPTTDEPRLVAFVERELTRRGITLDEARGLPPFAPFFRDLIEFEPEACPDGIGIDDDGMLRWSGGAARMVWVLEADAQAPGVPPNFDLPEGTIWALRSETSAAPMSCGMTYGEVPADTVQRVPTDGAPPALTSGETYFLDVQRDLAQPITRCLFVAP